MNEPPPTSSPFPVVAIGASAGGVEALQALFEALPDRPGAAFVVVVHLAPEHRSQLATILARRTAMAVDEVQDTLPLERDRVYVIPPNRRLQLTDTEVSALPFDEPRGQRNPIDLFFRSLAKRFGDGYAIILSGGGSDGTLGIKAVKEQGGVILVQDPNEAAFDSMPRSAIATGMSDVVLPIRELADRLVELIESRHRLEERLQRVEKLDDDDQATLGDILAHLQKRTGHDFSKYKRATVLRRVARRMQLLHAQSLADYLALLQKNVEEVQALFDEFLISVTTFFRDPGAWETLARRVIPRLFEDRPADLPLRVWVPGCATGEEAYSLAILLLEEAERQEIRPGIQVFASDLDEGALATGREGRYPAAIETDVSEARLQRFFKKVDGHYRVTQELRDCVVFAAHSLLRDPPFSRLDLISCRNLLIYLDRELQEQVFGVFAYALGPGGYLFLGISESAEGDYFRALDKQHHIYQAHRIVHQAPPLLPEMLAGARPHHTAPHVPEQRRAVPVSVSAVHGALLEELAPPSLLVDERHNVLHLSETAGRFLQPAGGPLQRDVMTLVRPELHNELGPALFRALEKGEPTLSPFVPVGFNGSPHRVAVLVQPRIRDDERLALVVFLDRGETVPAEEPPAGGAGDGALAQRLREELHQTKLRLRRAQEEFDSSNEELRAANEELQSLNEEYRSTAEELETSKEELQSINEELQTVNAELKSKLEEIARAHSDLENLMAATEIGTLFLDRDLRIRRFTPSVTRLFRIRPEDRGRPITDLSASLDYEDLESDVRQVLEQLTRVERELRHQDGRWYLTRLRPYRTEDHRIDGVVISFVDITDRKRAEQTLREAYAYAESIVQTVPQPLLILTPDLRVKSANQAFYEHFRVEPGRTEGRLIYDLGNHQWDIPELRRLLEDVLPANDRFAEFEVSHEFEQLGRRTMRLHGQRLDSVQLILLAIEDITEHKLAREALEEADRNKNAFIAMLAHELRNPLAAISNSAAVLSEQTPVSDQRSRPVRIIEQQLAHLVRLVDDLLSLSRISRGKIELQRSPMNLADIVPEAVQLVRVQIDRGGHRLELRLPEAPVVVEGDAHRLTQIAVNLISNAAAYTEAGGLITVAVEQVDDQALLRVRDTGIGIATEELSQLFLPFQRLGDAARRHAGGLGLGLALARELAALHGGTLEASSPGIGQGSEFLLRLPALPASVLPDTEPPHPPEAAGPSRRILVVEDEQAVGEALTTVLEALGHKVRLVSTGRQVSDAVETFSPELILLDIGLPDISGYEVARRLRQSHPPDTLPLIALTGWGHEEHLDEVNAAGFDRVLLKPASMQDLQGVLRDFAARSEESRKD